MLPPYVEGGRGTPAALTGLVYGIGGPEATNPGGNVSKVIGITGLDGVEGFVVLSSMGGRGRSPASSALRKLPCDSAGSMFDSGRD